MYPNKIRVNDTEYPLTVIREERDRAVVSLGRRGVSIRIPLDLPREEQFRKIRKMLKWAQKKLQERPIITKGSKEYQDNQIVKVGEWEYLLRLSYANKESSSAKIKDNIISCTISVSLPRPIQNKHISVLLSRVIARQHIMTVTQRIQQLNQQHFNFSLKKVFLKYNMSNWGSCSVKNNLNVSTRVLFAPLEVRDYLYLHELAHLQEHNHSPAFWHLVERAMPDYKEKEQWLKKHSDECWF